MTVAIEMGQTTTGEAATLDLEELLATRLLVQGNSGSGKSHLLRRLLEQSAPWVQQTIIDPEGDFVTLSEHFGHLVIDAEAHTEQGLQLAGERARIGIGAAMVEDDVWQDVSARAAILPEDIQGIFIMLARAAREGLPCPGDPAIARAYGTRSLGRARRVLTYIEEQGLIVCQADGAGRRIVTLVELAWATAPGDPNAEDMLAG